MVMNLFKNVIFRPAPSLSILLLLGMSLVQYPAWAGSFGGISDSIDDSLISDERAGTRDSHPLFFQATVAEGQEAVDRARRAVEYANSFTCADATPYQAAAQAAMDNAVASNNMIQAVTSNRSAIEHRDAARAEAAEATRNAHLAAQACGEPVDSADIYPSPFDEQPGTVPGWNSTFWDISSP